MSSSQLALTPWSLLLPLVSGTIPVYPVFSVLLLYFLYYSCISCTTPVLLYFLYYSCTAPVLFLYYCCTTPMFPVLFLYCFCTIPVFLYHSFILCTIPVFPQRSSARLQSSLPVPIMLCMLLARIGLILAHFPLHRYLRQIAVITPYAEFQFFYKSAADDKANTRVVFRCARSGIFQHPYAGVPHHLCAPLWHSRQTYTHTQLLTHPYINPHKHVHQEHIYTFTRRPLPHANRRRTDVMPPPPDEVKHHPSSVDLELIKRLISITKVRA